MPESQQKETLLHEIGHAILYHHGHEYMDAKQKEAILDAFANGLYNMGVAEFLMEEE
jgi:hypothetical protein